MESGENFASLSRLIGRNDAYIQQYLRKGTPRSFRERERRALARYFSVPESMLGGMAEEFEAECGDLIPIARSPVHGAAGTWSHAERGNPATLFCVRSGLAQIPDRFVGVKAVGDPGRGRFHGANVERR